MPKEDIMNPVERGRCGIHPAPVHGYVRLPEKYGNTSSQPLKAAPYRPGGEPF